MTAETRIENYTSELAKALGRLPAVDRTEIVSEIRSHLEFRAAEDRLDEATRALGSPRECARGFIEELRLQEAYADGGPTKTIGTLLALASRRVTATAGLFVSGIFFVLALGLALSGVAEVVVPESAGLWVNGPEGKFFFGTIDRIDRDGFSEILGRWMLPVAIALSVISFVIAQWLGRFFLRLMMKKNAAVV